MRRHLATLLVSTLLVASACGDDSESESAGVPESPGTAEQEELATSLGFSSWSIAANNASLYCVLLADVEGRIDLEAEVRALDEQRTLAGPFDSLPDEVAAIVLLTEQTCPEVHERIIR